MRLHNRITTMIDLFFLMRPVVLIPYWGYALLGFYLVSFGKDFHLFNFLSFFKLNLVLIFSLAAGSVLVLNQIADIDVDKKNGGLPLLAKNIVSKKMAYIFAIILGLLSILLPIQFDQKHLALCSVSGIVLGIFYSFKPTYFSGRPFLDFLANALASGVAFTAGAFISGIDLDLGQILLLAFPYLLLMCAGSISSTLPDYNGDKDVGKITTAVYLGIKRAHLIALLFIIAALVFSIFVKDTIGFTCALIALPIYIAYTLVNKPLLMEATYKVGGGSMMIIVGILFPQFLILSGLTFLITWCYYRYRHKVSYPSLVPYK